MNSSSEIQFFDDEFVLGTAFGRNPKDETIPNTINVKE